MDIFGVKLLYQRLISYMFGQSGKYSEDELGVILKIFMILNQILRLNEDLEKIENEETRQKIEKDLTNTICNNSVLSQLSEGVDSIIEESRRNKGQVNQAYIVEDNSLQLFKEKMIRQDERFNLLQQNIERILRIIENQSQDN
ncbi:MAG: hypothetical protein F6J86_37810 [Symploca sp. SIO1B1]|nr:hypothetical protein [Symploca sp. SIO1A3]NER99510.1 hypothetical protein [Symploca sp. SIO1B1]